MLVFGVVVARTNERDVFECLVLRGNGRALFRREFPLLDFQILLELLVGSRRILGVERQKLLVDRRALRLAKNSVNRARICVFSSTTENSGTSFTPSRCARTAMKSPLACSIGKIFIERRHEMFVRPAVIVRCLRTSGPACQREIQ